MTRAGAIIRTSTAVHSFEAFLMLSSLKSLQDFLGNVAQAVCAAAMRRLEREPAEGTQQY